MGKSRMVLLTMGGSSHTNYDSNAKCKDMFKGQHRQYLINSLLDSAKLITTTNHIRLSLKILKIANDAAISCWVM